MAAHDQSETAPPPTDPGPGPIDPSTRPPGAPPPPPTLPPIEDPIAEPGPRPEAADPSIAEDPLGPPPGLAGLAGPEDPLGPLPTGPGPDRVATDDAVMVPSADGTAEPAAADLVTAPDGKKSRLDVNGTQLCASTLASVSAAVVSSVFGVTGTAVGAAVGSVLATTGTAFYSHGLRQTTVKLQQTQAVQLSRWARLWAGGRVANEALSKASASSSASGATTSGSTADGDDADRPAWKDWLAERRWGLVIGVVIVFVASMAAITTVELVGQGPIAGATGNDSSGNTSIGSFLDADSNSDKDDGLDPVEGDQAPGDTDTTVASDDPGTDPGTDDGSTDTTVEGSGPGTDPGATEPPADPGTDPGTDTGMNSGAATAG